MKYFSYLHLNFKHVADTEKKKRNHVLCDEEFPSLRSTTQHTLCSVFHLCTIGSSFCHAVWKLSTVTPSTSWVSRMDGTLCTASSFNLEFYSPHYVNGKKLAAVWWRLVQSLQQILPRWAENEISLWAWEKVFSLCWKSTALVVCLDEQCVWYGQNFTLKHSINEHNQKSVKKQQRCSVKDIYVLRCRGI